MTIDKCLPIERRVTSLPVFFGGLIKDESGAQAPCELTVLIPCLNEAEILGTCISKAKASIKSIGLKGEVLVADNRSTDDSQKIAGGLGVRVVNVEPKGYGNELMRSIATAQGTYVIMRELLF